ncbi:ATP-binding protein [Trinickia violacea]|uniref:ATP-binding protein n=1 Tax=Trinickia violacea TaxID=2571746 RepID=A0A4P8ILL1_9BURK|nr:AAA family ATPase [Trinickia violacea]QCP49802.1 ATP-binding protein [Trinickia violacea]
MTKFEHSLAHLLAEMEWVDLLIRALVARVRTEQTEDDQFRGLYLSEARVDALLAAPLGAPSWLAAGVGRDQALPSRLAPLREQIAARRQASVAAGVELRLERLRSLFGLSELDVGVLLISVAVGLDARYERLYAYLQDDVTKTRPSVDLVLNLLEVDPLRRFAARACFDADAPLRRYRLIEMFDDPSRPTSPLIGRFLKVDDRIVSFLLGSDQLDDRIAPYVRRMELGQALDSLVVEDGVRRGLQQLAVDARGTRRLVVHLQGRAGSGRRTIAKALALACGRPLVGADLERMQQGADFSTCLVLIDREARLAGAALYWSGFDALTSDEHRPLLAAFRQIVEKGPALAFVAGETAHFPVSPADDVRYVSVALPPLSGPQRLELWRRALSGRPFDIDAADLSGIATRFRFTPRQIDESAYTAMNLASWRAPGNARVAVQDLYDACRHHSNRTLATLARKITPRVGWDDIVLPPDRIVQLREICNHMKYRHQVFSEWGFERKLVSSKGLMALFAGPSGTGKTMAAEIIAGDLGLDLYKIDLSSVISKFIGETEKNLARIFDEAETANAVLFFDEADALFGKRSEVKDSHDRYANIEVGYLLQRIEEYEGIAILATNFRRNMDEAFVRRLQFTVDFALPGEADRYRMWQRILPEQTPRDPAIDLALLACRFDLTGGSIRNIALAAAFLAADEHDIVRMPHLIAATQREYRKMGKLVADGEFGTASE